MANNKRHNSGHFKNGCILACGLVFALIIFALIIFAFYEFNFFDSFVLSSDNLTAKEISQVDTLIKSNKIITAGDVISHITSFYSVIITILVGVLGLVGLLGYFHIKTLTIEKLTEHKNSVTKSATGVATEKVQQYLQTKEFANTIDKSVSEALEGTDIDIINKKIARLENKIDEILSSPGTAAIENIPEGVADAAAPAPDQQPVGGDNGNN